MKISCEIIRDILPLYAEDMVSGATREFVDSHLCGCESCAGELESIQKKDRLPVEADVSSVKRVGESIRRRQILAVMAVLLFVATVLLGGALMLDAKIYLSAEESVEEIYVTDTGVNIRWDDRITGTSGSFDKEDPTNYEVVAWTNLYNYLFFKGRVSYDELAPEVKELITEGQYQAMDNISHYALEKPEETNFIYTCPRDHSMTLILNADQPLPDGPQIATHSDILYYLLGMAGFSVLCFFLEKYFRGKWYGELVSRIAIVAGSLAISVIIVTAGQVCGLERDFQEAVIDSTAVAIPMALFGLCVRQLIKLNRQDKGL